MKNKVLIVSNMYPSSQKPYAGIYVKNLYQKLCAEGINVDILTMPRRFTNRLASLLKYCGFMFSSLRYLFSRYDLVHLHFFYPLIIWVWLYRLLHSRAKIVATFHGSDVNQHFNSGLMRTFGRYLAKSVDVYIAVGEALAQSAEDKLAVEVKHVVPAGVDTDLFNEFSLSGEKEYDFIFVGSFTELKGVNEFVEALSKINMRCRLCFVGSGPLQQKILNLKSAHSVSLYENLTQPEIANLYGQARFLVLPSRTESFGLVASEAMYCGTPVLASRVGGIVMQVKPEENGILFEKENVGEIAACLKIALNMDSVSYERLAQNALTSNPNFSLQVVVENHLAIYSGLLNGY